MHFELDDEMADELLPWFEKSRKFHCAFSAFPSMSSDGSIKSMPGEISPGELVADSASPIIVNPCKKLLTPSQRRET